MQRGQGIGTEKGSVGSVSAKPLSWGGAGGHRGQGWSHGLDKAKGGAGQVGTGEDR